jgi:predicted Zn finger-like uncharacterized protein
MSLATRCTACGTVFRVVQDQLKISEGWVRCGRCAEVFDAREQLFDLEREAPPPWPRPAEPQLPAEDDEPLDIALDEDRYDELPPEAAAPPSQPPDEDTWEMHPNEDGSLAPEVPGSEPTPSRFSASQIAQWEDDTPAATFEPEAPRPAHSALYLREAEPDFEPAELAPPVSGLSRRVADDDSRLAADPDDSPMPSFVRNAAEARPPMPRRQRQLWAGAGGVLALLLAAQALFHYRDALAAMQPGLQAPLKAMCDSLGCEIKPLQHIESLSVEGSALTRANGEAGNYRLAVTLRNRADATLALPSFELSLTDSSGGLLARRVLSPAQFAASAPGAAASSALATIAPKSELSLQTSLRANDTRLVGYTVEVFYP